MRCWSGWSLCGVVVALNFVHRLHASPSRAKGRFGFPLLALRRGGYLFARRAWLMVSRTPSMLLNMSWFQKRITR